jgi:hypothetical protein
MMVTLVKFSIRCTQLSIQEIVARWSVLLRQYLYFFASKASKSSMCPFFGYVS